MLVLLMCSALVSGSEVAFFSMGPTDLDKLREDDRDSAKRVLTVLESPNMEQGPRQLLGTILVLNNFINILIILLSTAVIGQIFPEQDANATLAFAVNIVGVTTIIVLFGEVIPKIYAINYRFELARVMALPLIIAQKVFYVVWKPMVFMSQGIENKLRTLKNENVSLEELEHALELTDNEERTEEEKKIFEGIVSFGLKDVKQIMTPRTDVMAISVSDPWHEMYKEVIDKGYSRIPVFRESIDQIAGILYIKDLLPHIDEPGYAWNTLIRQPFFVPENKKIDDLLREFQGRKMHMAVVVDEYGGTSGIVTLEDIIEEIVGDITDEFDEDDIHYSQLDEHTFIFEGKTALIDIYRIFDIDGGIFEAAKGDSDTLAGFVIEIAGKIPLKGERYHFDQYEFTVEASDRRRVKRVKVQLKTNEDIEEANQ